MSILIERRFGTAPYWMPVERGWIESSIDVRIAETLTPADLRANNGPVIVDSLLASTVLKTSLIVEDHGVSADTISLLSLITSTRPDGIDQTQISVAGVSLAGQAVSEIVVNEFYGITVTGWIDEPVQLGPETARVTEDVDALLPTENPEDFHEDLGRAWYLTTNTPFVSHVCLVPESAYRDSKQEIAASVRALAEMKAAANEQRRLLRRNLSRDHGIERDLVVDLFDGLQLTLNSASQKGLTTLYDRSGVLDRVGPIDARFIAIDGGTT